MYTFLVSQQNLRCQKFLKVWDCYSTCKLQKKIKSLSQFHGAKLFCFVFLSVCLIVECITYIPPFPSLTSSSPPPPPWQQFYAAEQNDAQTTLCGLCCKRGTQPKELQSFMDSKHTWPLFQGDIFLVFYYTSQLACLLSALKWNTISIF